MRWIKANPLFVIVAGLMVVVNVFAVGLWQDWWTAPALFAYLDSRWSVFVHAVVLLAFSVLYFWRKGR